MQLKPINHTLYLFSLQRFTPPSLLNSATLTSGFISVVRLDKISRDLNYILARYSDLTISSATT